MKLREKSKTKIIRDQHAKDLIPSTPRLRQNSEDLASFVTILLALHHT
jgi:hypothetical protein